MASGKRSARRSRRTLAPRSASLDISVVLQARPRVGGPRRQLVLPNWAMNPSRAHIPRKAWTLPPTPDDPRKGRGGKSCSWRKSPASCFLLHRRWLGATAVSGRCASRSSISVRGCTRTCSRSPKRTTRSRTTAGRQRAVPRALLEQHRQLHGSRRSGQALPVRQAGVGRVPRRATGSHH
jgi:hypothetical protein